jgi:hypothetical protein
MWIFLSANPCNRFEFFAHPTHPNMFLRVARLPDELEMSLVEDDLSVCNIIIRVHLVASFLML